MLVFEKYDLEHQKLWDSMKIIRDASALDKMASKVRQHQAVYKKVQAETGVPWQMVAVIHIREAGLSDVGVFKRGIHNGQPWSQKTTIVPIGVGPFPSWHDAAVHALKMKKFHTVKSWTPAKMLSALEPYNGYGYRGKGLRSPYLWASTNHQQRGKYVRDHVFDPNVMDTQMGAAAMLKFLGVGQATQGDKAIKETGGVVVSTATMAWIFQEHIIPILIVGGIALATVWMYRYFNSRNK